MSTNPLEQMKETEREFLRGRGLKLLAEYFLENIGKKQLDVGETTKDLDEDERLFLVGKNPQENKQEIVSYLEGLLLQSDEETSKEIHRTITELQKLIIMFEKNELRIYKKDI